MSKQTADTEGYEVVTGLNYEDKRAEPGDIVTDLPKRSIKWLLKDGHIRKPGTGPKEEEMKTEETEGIEPEEEESEEVAEGEGEEAGGEPAAEPEVEQEPASTEEEGED